MPNPKDILHTLHLIRAGLASGLLSKEEVIDWADKIVIRDNEPDIFFIDLALSGSGSLKDVLHYFNAYLNFESPVIEGRPLLGLLYKRFSSKQWTLEETVSKLYRLKFEALYSAREESYIYSFDNDFDCAKDGIYGSLEVVNAEVDNFLGFYKGYCLENFEQWPELDLQVERMLDEHDNIKQESVSKNISENVNRRWWKFW